MVICFIRVPEGETVIALTKSIEDRGQSKQEGLKNSLSSMLLNPEVVGLPFAS